MVWRAPHDRSCGCKGWEDSPGTAAKCGFCGHDAESHRVVPHPPWFMDQYETYAGIESTSSPSFEVTGDQGELEDHRGRLGTSALIAIARTRYLRALQDYELTAAISAPVVGCGESAFSSSALGIEDTTKDASMLDTSGDGWTMLPLHGLEGEEGTDTDVQGCEHDEAAELDEDASTSRENVDADDGDSCSMKTAKSIPWYLQQDLSALHPESCCCHHRDLLATADMLKQYVVSHWLRHSAAQYVASPSVSNSPLTLQTAFTRWRRTQIDKADESVQAAGVASPAILTPQQRKRLCVVLRHWRSANAFVALQRWKHATDTSMQLRHHRVESILDDVVAHMRQNRFTSLRARQMQLQKSIARMQWEEEALKLHWR